MMTTDHPILNQWVQYIAYGVACEILRQRQDMDGVANLMEGFKRKKLWSSKDKQPKKSEVKTKPSTPEANKT